MMIRGFSTLQAWMCRCDITFIATLCLYLHTLYVIFFKLRVVTKGQYTGKCQSSSPTSTSTKINAHCIIKKWRMENGAYTIKLLVVLCYFFSSVIDNAHIMALCELTRHKWISWSVMHCPLWTMPQHPHILMTSHSLSQYHMYIFMYMLLQPLNDSYWLEDTYPLTNGCNSLVLTPQFVTVLWACTWNTW